MEIERINENTIKFYISYMDIENLGFDREEIWYNRERSEQLFWEVMEEANYNEEDFSIEGPLWIQVQALDKGLEIVVTKAKISKDGQNLELPVDNGLGLDLPIDEKLESLLDEKFGKEDDDIEAEDELLASIEQDLIHVFQFDDFEDLIQLSHNLTFDQGITDRLYHYQGRYHLLVQFDDVYLNVDQQDDYISRLKEYSNRSKVTVHLLSEYGKVIFSDHALAQVKQYFNQ